MKMFRKRSRFVLMLPNLLTLSNALAGFVALLLFFSARSSSPESLGTELAGWFVLFAVLFDGLDGYTARKLDATSAVGLQLDSLADFFTFGSVPAIILAVIGISSGIFPLMLFTVLSASLYLCCAAWRLAVYNVLALEGKSGSSFSGLPVPGAAAAVMSALLLVAKSGNALVFVPFIGIYFIIAALLMVGKVSYIHMWKWITSERRGVRYVLLAVVFFTMVFALGPVVAATVSSFLYILSGFLWPVIARRLHFLSGGEGPKPSEERS